MSRLSITNGPFSDESIAMLLSGGWSEDIWVGNEISHMPPLQLKSDHVLLNRYKNHLCTLSWQLEQLEMKKTIEFETLCRKYSNQVMPSLRRDCRNLHRLDPDGPLILWQSLIQEVEDTLESCRQSFGNLARIREHVVWKWVWEWKCEWWEIRMHLFMYVCMYIKSLLLFSLAA